MFRATSSRPHDLGTVKKYTHKTIREVRIMERTEIGIGNMRIDVVDDNVVYLIINGYTYYIDDSTNEQIFKKWDNIEWDDK